MEKAAGQVGAGLMWAAWSDPPIAAIAAVLGVAFSAAPVTSSNHSIPNFDNCWDDSRSTWDRPPTDFSTVVGNTDEDGNTLTEEQRQDLIKKRVDVEQDDYHMIPVVHIIYTDFFLEADGYDHNGFAGLVHTKGTSPNTSGNVIGQFVYQATAGGGHA